MITQGSHRAASLESVLELKRSYRAGLLVAFIASVCIHGLLVGLLSSFPDAWSLPTVSKVSNQYDYRWPSRNVSPCPEFTISPPEPPWFPTEHRVVRVGGLCGAVWGMPPKLIQSVAPRYPRLAQEVGLEATLVLQVYIDELGDVTQVIIVRPSFTDLGFEESAVEAVKQWKYEPALSEGRPVGIWLNVPVRFSVH